MPTTRLRSLDAFRGLTMAAMILANNPGSWDHIYGPLEHANWNGCTLTDLVFPFFLFIVGVAIPFSQSARMSRGDRPATVAGGVITRSVSLALLGLLLYSIPTRLSAPLPDGHGWLLSLQWTAIGFVPVAFVLLLWPWRRQRVASLVVAGVAVAWTGLFFLMHWTIDAAGDLPARFDFGTGLLDPRMLRFPGVLQRIAVCYLVAGLANLPDRRWLLWLAAIVCCAGYAALMSHISFGGSVPGSYARDTNLAHAVDVWLFGPHAYKSYADPEGLLSTLPAIATTLLGVLAGRMLFREDPPAERSARLLTGGVALVAVGVLLEWWAMPINKQLWTPSYVAFTAGLACLTLGAMFYVVDARGRQRWAAPLAAMGTNAILVFLLSGILGRVFALIRTPIAWMPPIDSMPRAADVPLRTLLSAWVRHVQECWTPVSWHTPEAASLAYAIGFLGTLWVICSVLYGLRWQAKV